MSNTCPTTGIRYGVIAMNSLDGDLSNELFYGPQAVDLSYKAAYEDAKAEATAKYISLQEEAKISAAESGADREVGFDQDRYFEMWMHNKNLEDDEEMFVDRELEAFSDMCNIEEPTIEGEYEGVKYQIGWLGGAALLWVLVGPQGYADRLCSPCVPGAADLDGGFTLLTETFTKSPSDTVGYHCFCIPRNWLNEVTACSPS